jgi:DNA polymerase (family 10)
MDYFTTHPLVSAVVSKGDTKASVTLVNGINADLRVVEDSQYPYALHHFTGSREHNTAMRHLARRNDLKMNEYGIFRGEEEELVRCSSEEDIFGLFGMQYIPPELRENNGELEAALEGRLPVLLEAEDIRGVIHMHSVYSDGSNTIEELARACINRGYSYMGLTDHSRTAVYAGGLNEADIKRQHEEIDSLLEKYPGFRIFKGIELEILPNGSVDYDEEILSLFDFTIASVHSSHGMDEARMTARVIKALRNKHVTMLGHPTGRLLLSREPARLNKDEVIKAAAEERVILEINANPNRLDLDWRFCKAARDAGCSFVVSPDAHRIEEIDDIRYGVNTARKGWLRAGDVVNTRTAEAFAGLLKARMQGR